MTNTQTESIKVYYGIEHLQQLNTSISIVLDTETLQITPEQGKLRLIQLGCRTSKIIVIIDCFDLEDSDWEILKRFFNNGPRYWTAHNAVFDIAWLQEHGIYPKAHRFGCTMLASRLLTNGIPKTSHRLDDLAKRYLSVDISKDLQTSDWSAVSLSKEQLEYAAKDVQVLMELETELDKKLAKNLLHPAYTLECKALPALAQMWRTGLPWNPEALEQCRLDYEHDAKEMSKEFISALDAALPEEHKLPREGDTRIKYLENKLSEMGNSLEERTVWNRELEQLYEDREIAAFNLRSKDEGSIRLGTKEYRGFNINSPKQLLEKLAVLGLTPKDVNGKPSASRQVLRNYAADHEVIQMYLTWKKTEKRRQMITSIQEKMDLDGFVKASYMQLGADTGRMSCIKPNNQQIPRDPNFRQCVEAPEGWVLVDADYGQMELRLAAALSKDEKMIEVFQNNEDLHEVTAAAIGCDRQVAKSANFGLLYGAGAEGLRNYAGANGIKMTKKEADEIRTNWLTTFSGINTWQVENQNKALKTACEKWPEIRIPMSGMRRFLKGDLNRVTIRCNTPIQGAGAAVLKCALGSLWPYVEKAGEDVVKIAAAVHDEILLLVKEDYAEYWAALLREKMEKAEAKWLGEIPALAETCIGKKWSEVH